MSYPLLWPLFSFALILLTFLLHRLPDLIAWALFGIAVIAPVIGLLANVIYYPLNEKYIGRLVAVYVSLMLLFANIYFIILAFDTGRSAFVGIAPGGWIQDGVAGGWVQVSLLDTSRFVWKNMFQSLVDCVHFSTVTITTLGYGDMHPTAWYSKLVADLEVFLGLGVTAIGVGRYLKVK